MAPSEGKNKQQKNETALACDFRKEKNNNRTHTYETGACSTITGGPACVKAV